MQLSQRCLWRNGTSQLRMHVGTVHRAGYRTVLDFVTVSCALTQLTKFPNHEQVLFPHIRILALFNSTAQLMRDGNPFQDGLLSFLKHCNTSLNLR